MWMSKDELKHKLMRAITLAYTQGFMDGRAKERGETREGVSGGLHDAEEG